MGGWAYCGEDSDGRPMGYSIVATCDEEGCEVTIDRGLAYVCGGMHEGGEYGCGKYFCDSHLGYCSKDWDNDKEETHQLCDECCRELEKIGEEEKHESD